MRRFKIKFTGRTKALILLLLLLSLSACGSTGRELATGNQAFDEEDYNQAAEAYQGIVDEAPLQPEPLYNLANTRYRQGIYTDTHELLPIAAATGSEQLAIQSHFNQGNAHYQLQDWESAIEAYKETLRLNSGDVDAKYNLELAMRNIVQQEQEQQDQEQQDNQENQEQEQQDQEQEQQDQEQQGSSDGEQEEQEQEQQDSSDGEQEEQEQQQEQSGDQEEQPEDENSQSADAQDAEPQEGLTEEQARQLLRAVGENTETLQEQIQMVVPADGAPPEKDW